MMCEEFPHLEKYKGCGKGFGIFLLEYSMKN